MTTKIDDIKRFLKTILTSYIPNKYNIASKLFGYMSYLIILSNVFAYCAYKYSKVVEQPGGYKAWIYNRY